MWQRTPKSKEKLLEKAPPKDKQGRQSNEKIKPFIPGLPAEEIKKKKNKIKKPKLNKNDFLISPQGKVEDFVFTETEEDENESDEDSPGFFSKNTAKAIQKEEYLNLLVQQSNKLKRPLNSPDSDQVRKTRTLSSC